MKLPQRQVNDPRAQQNFDQIQKLIDSKWHYIGATGEPAFTNAWVNYDAGRPARYRIEGRRCFVDGLVKNGTLGLAAFTIPVTPDILGNQDFATESNSAFGSVYVSTTGAVVPNLGSNVYMFLSTVNFPIVP